MSLSIQDRVYIVTGAGRGLGETFAHALAEAGAAIVVAGRTESDLNRVAGEIAAKGHRASAFRCDATEEAQCSALVEATVKEYGRLDGAVINHGVGLHKLALETTKDEFEHMLANNLTSYFLMAREIARNLVLRKAGGSIVLISSNASFLAYDEIAAYGISKAGVDQMCRQLAGEWAAHGIRVNAIGPGYMTASMRGIESIYDAPEVKAKILPRIPAGRYGLASELVGAIQYFLSDASSYTTGQYLAIDGGYSLY